MSLGWIRSFVASCESLTPASDARVGIRLRARPARTANVRGIAAWLRSVPVWVVAGRVRGVHEESTPHKASTGGGTRA
jgi:hypothetical protein